VALKEGDEFIFLVEGKPTLCSSGYYPVIESGKNGEFRNHSFNPKKISKTASDNVPLRKRVTKERQSPPTGLIKMVAQ